MGITLTTANFSIMEEKRVLVRTSVVMGNVVVKINLLTLLVFCNSYPSQVQSINAII